MPLSILNATSLALWETKNQKKKILNYYGFINTLSFVKLKLRKLNFPNKSIYKRKCLLLELKEVSKKQ